jgi:hypothetical protein
VGFGCSALVGGRTAREARYLLDAAWDVGIRHFDTARVYGTGDAEAILGAFAASRREEITIATKFGIEPIGAGRTTAAVKVVGRAALRRSRRLLRLARRYSAHTARRGQFAPGAARASLETSLGLLRSDYVDAFLLHDCTAKDWSNADTVAALEELRLQRRVLAYGTATSCSETEKILAGGSIPAVTQFDADAFSGNARRVQSIARGATAITYGVLNRALPSVIEALTADVTRVRWERALELRLRSVGEIAGLLLAHALWSNPFGLVLFSAGDPQRIIANTLAATRLGRDTDRLMTADGLLRGLAVVPGRRSNAARSLRR